MLRNQKTIDLGDGHQAIVKELSVSNVVQLVNEIGPSIQEADFESKDGQIKGLIELIKKSESIIIILNEAIDLPDDYKLEDLGCSVILKLWESFKELNNSFFQRLGIKITGDLDISSLSSN